MGLLKRIENGTTTTEDATTVKNLMSSHVDKTYQIMRMGAIIKALMIILAVVTVVSALTTLF